MKSDNSASKTAQTEIKNKLFIIRQNVTNNPRVLPRFARVSPPSKVASRTPVHARTCLIS
jgi:hypothetical protein